MTGIVKMMLPTGVEKRIARPLDFAAVTVHAEALVVYEACTNPGFAGYAVLTTIAPTSARPSCNRS